MLKFSQKKFPIAAAAVFLVLASFFAVFGIWRPWLASNERNQAAQQPDKPLVEGLVVGKLGTNCYLIGSSQTREAVVIDPGEDSGRITARAKALNLQIRQIILTHGHFDHLLALDQLRRATGAKAFIHGADASMLEDAGRNVSTKLLGKPRTFLPVDGRLQDGDVVKVGGLRITVIHTPGHTPGSITLAIGDQMLFTGDTLFKGAVGSTAFPGGSAAALETSVQRLLSFADSTKVFPGHGGPTTIGEERRQTEGEMK